MKKYIFKWYNPNYSYPITEIILAKDKQEAEQIAMLIVKLHTGQWCNVKTAYEFDELTDEYCTSMEKIKERYKECKEKFILPEIK